MKRLAGALLLLTLASGLAACGDSESPFDIQETEFAPELGIDLSTMEERPSGLFLETLEEGDGDVEVALGGEMWVHYALWLEDGTLVGTTRGTDENTDEELDPQQMTLGPQIDGFVEGVEGMVAGEVRRLVIPPSLGYGEGGTRDGVIPGGAVLIFEIEMISIGDPPADPEEEETE